jgi:hypothetical protein
MKNNPSVKILNLKHKKETTKIKKNYEQKRKKNQKLISKVNKLFHLK